MTKEKLVERRAMLTMELQNTEQQAQQQIAAQQAHLNQYIAQANEQLWQLRGRIAMIDEFVAQEEAAEAVPGEDAPAENVAETVN